MDVGLWHDKDTIRRGWEFDEPWNGCYGRTKGVLERSMTG